MLSRWMGLAHARSAAVAARLPECIFPLRPLSLLAPPGACDEAPTAQSAATEALAKLWSTLSSHFEAPLSAPPTVTSTAAGRPARRLPLQTIRQAAPDGGVESSGPEVWPLQGECVSQHALSSEGASSDKAGESKPLRLSAPIPLLHRKGEFIRAVCVNALNGSQLAVSLSRGVQQLELVSELASSPYLDSPSVSERSASSSQPQSDWLSWGVGVKNAATRLTETSFGATGEPLTVLQSSGSDLTARCLCAHPKVSSRS
eukprot:6206986-Pleurochrysis_carterae.AAC.1